MAWFICSVIFFGLLPVLIAVFKNDISLGPAIGLTVGVPVSVLLVVYFFMPAATINFWYWIGNALVMCAISTVVIYVSEDLLVVRRTSRRHGAGFNLLGDSVAGASLSGPSWQIGVITCVLLFVALVIGGFAGSPLFRATALANVIGTVENATFAENIPIVDNAHIRLVAKDTALAKASKVLGQSHDGDVLGSQLQIDTDSMAIQEVNGELWWIIPLDFSGFFKWNRRGEIPGYIRVSAHDPNRAAQLMDRNPETGQHFKLTNTPGAFFSHNLGRKVYWEYPNYVREDCTIEVDESWQPFYVYSATSPSVGWNGYKTRGVIIADPQTGTIKWEDQTPVWVDRVRPIDQTLQQVKWWGELREGYLNSLFGRRNLVKPTDIGDDGSPDMWFVRLGERNYWYTGITSASKSDDSLVGMMFVDTQALTGGATFYQMQGADEDGIMKAVDASLGAEKAVWHSTVPIPYNIWGRPSVVLPVISRDTGYFQRVAIVDLNEVTNLVVEENLSTAMLKYGKLIAQRYNEVAPAVAAEVLELGPTRVVRMGSLISGGNLTHLLYLEGAPDRIFATDAGTDATRLAALAQPSDAVTVSYIDTGEPLVQIESLSLEGVELRTSAEQEVFDEQRAESRKEERVEEDAQSAEQEFDQLSPEQKQAMLEAIKAQK